MNHLEECLKSLSRFSSINEKSIVRVLSTLRGRVYLPSSKGTRFTPQLSTSMNWGNRGLMNVDSINSRRSFFSLITRKRLTSMESQANDDVRDADKQASYLKALLLQGDCWAVIRRFEDPRFARNQDCIVAYLSALQQEDEFGRATRFFDYNPGGSPKFESNDEPPKFDYHRSTSTEFGAGDKLGGNLDESFLRMLNFGTKEKPLFVTNVPPTGFWRRLIGLLNMTLIGYLVYTYVGGLFNGGGEGRMIPGLGGGKAYQVYDPENPGERVVKFDDVLGCDEAKAELQEIVEFLKDPSKFDRLGAKMPKGVLLIGSPGTGKTLLARAVAGEADVPFIYASGSQFDEVFVGVGSMRIRQMFEAARSKAPAILFIDEIDAVASKRSAKDPQHARMSLNQLLTELDGFSDNPGVVVIAATNLPDSLDKALLRPGRFDRHVMVPLPDVKGRRQILDHFLNLDTLKGITTYQLGGETTKQLDTASLARATVGFSGAELYKLVNTARIRASVAGAMRLTQMHLEAAFTEMVMGVERRSALIPHADRAITAYHEGGHALVAMKTADAMPVHKATIVPRGRALGMVAQLPDSDELSVTKAQLLARMDVALGGRYAEEIVFGEQYVTTGASSDFEQATAIARAMVTQYGMSERLGPIVVQDNDGTNWAPQTRELIDLEIKRLMDESCSRVRSVLLENRAILDRIAAALLQSETLTRVEINAIVEGKAHVVSEKTTQKHEGGEAVAAFISGAAVSY